MLFGAYRAEAFCGRGRLDKAVQIIAEHLAIARDGKSRHDEGISLRVQGQIFAAQQKLEDAACAFDQAVALLDENSSRLELGRTLYQRGMLRRTQDDKDVARADLIRAHEIFEQCGARRDAEKTREPLKHLE